jgi:Protein of unknown function (DUF2914)
MGTTGYKVRYSAAGWSYVAADGAPVERAPERTFDRFPLTAPSPWPRRILLATVVAAAVIAVTAVALVFSIGDHGDEARPTTERSAEATASSDLTASRTSQPAEDRQGLAGAETSPPANWEAVLKPAAERSPLGTEALPSGASAAIVTASPEAETRADAEILTAPPTLATPADAARAEDAAVAERTSTSDEPAARTTATAKAEPTARESTATAALAPVQRAAAPTPNVRPAAPAQQHASAVSTAVPRMQLTSGMRGLEPADRLSSPIKLSGNTPRRLHLFSELDGLNGQTVYHVWEYEGRDRAIIPFKVGADKWRAHSNKKFRPSDAGQWRVVVKDSAGRELSSASFVVQ